MQTASDESYRDPTNLQSKLQKHQAFEAELSANKGRVDSVRQVKQAILVVNTLNKFAHACKLPLLILKFLKC